MRTRKCDKCAYGWSSSGMTESYCGYITMTGHRRPCPAGNVCEVYRTPRQLYRDQSMSWDVENARRLAVMGYTDAEIAAEVDRPVSSITAWRKKEKRPEGHGKAAPE